MLRFLSTKSKKQLRKEYTFRLVNIVLFIASIGIVFWAIALVPTYISLSADKKVLQNQIDKLAGSDSASGKAEFGKLKDTFEKKKNILLSDQIEMNEYIKLLQSSLPTGVYLDKIAIKGVKEGTDERVVDLRGVAPDRDTLLVFSDTLEKQVEFKGIDLPFSLFAKSEDIPFSLTFSAIVKK